jgi:toxin HigB-1
MIKTFKDRATTDIAEGLQSKVSLKLLPQELHKNAMLKIALINTAKTLLDLSTPGLRLEKLRGDLQGFHSLRINKQYRICFQWREDGVYNVVITDYH